MDCFRPSIFLILTMLTQASQASVDKAESRDSDDRSAATYELTTIAVVRNAPDGQIVDIWDPNTRFTSTVADDGWVKITGHFPSSDWQALPEPLWIDSNYVRGFTPKKSAVPTPKRRPDGSIRYIEVDKSDFELRVIEEKNDDKAVLFKTVVALGMDRCLPKSKGGRCYYTEPGEYHVRWKVHDPKGIKWCIPKSMEKEYSKEIARGERCYRGAIGKYALNIGKTYAIHGTKNEGSLGKRVSHGCVRTANNDIRKIYSMMEIGDKVYIVD
jgi:hypothetical protein